MPRRPRVFAEGGLFHVHNRTARGVPVFEPDVAGATFVSLLRKIVRRDGLTVYAWCLMSNHYHIVVRSGPVPLSRTFGVLQGRFGQQHNRARGWSGPLWQSRYKAKLVEEEGYLYKLIAYVHLNPVSAGLVDDPAEWRWSGHGEVLGRHADPVIAVDTVLPMYGGNPTAARQAYVNSLKGERNAIWVAEGPGRLPWWGREADSFGEVPVPAAWIDDRGTSSGLTRRRIVADEYLARACGLLGVTPQEIGSPRRGAGLTRARWLIASIGIERWRQSPKRLAALLGRHADVVTRWARRGSEARLADQKFARDAANLDEGLAESERSRVGFGQAQSRGVGPGTEKRWKP